MMKRKCYNCGEKQLNIDLYRKASLGIPISNEELEKLYLHIDSPAVTELPESIDTVTLKIFNRTLLSLVCTAGNCENLKKLLIHGSNPKQETSDKRQPIITATIAGHVDIIEILISYDVNINCKMKGGWTPLLLAVCYNRFELVEKMIEKFKADPNLPNDDGKTPMHIAASNGYNEVLRILLKYDVDINCKMKGGWTPLLLAVSNNRFGLVNEMIELGADPNLPNDDGRTPVYIAASKGYSKIINILLKYGVDINCKMKGGWTPLLVAVSNNHSELVDEMIGKLKADPNFPYDDVQTPMYIAASKGFNEIINILLKYRVDLSISRSGFATPLMIASQLGYLETCRLLLLYGAKVNYKMENGLTALLLAVAFNHPEIVDEMIEHYLADPNLPDNVGRTPMFIAASKGNNIIIKILIRYGADLNIPSSNGSTPLLVASKFGFLKSCRLLLKYGADINCKNEKGDTPLMSAVINNHSELVDEMIRQFKADPNITYENGQTLIHIAASKGYNEVLRILLKYSADINCKMKGGWTPLLLAVSNNHLDLVDEMIRELGADPNLPNEDGKTPIYIAARNGYSGIIKVLLKNGADVNIPMADDMDGNEPNGTTPLMVACEFGHFKSCHLLLLNGAYIEADLNDGYEYSNPLSLAVLSDELKLVKLLVEFGVDTSKFVIEIDPTEGPSFVEEYLQSVANERQLTNLASVMKSIINGILPLDILQILLFCLSKDNIIELHKYINSIYKNMLSCHVICSYGKYPSNSILSIIGQGYDGPAKQLIIDYLVPNSESRNLINKFKFILDDTFDQTVEIDLEEIKNKIRDSYSKLFL